jgi:BirA family transcriptional regulator, biotin operon repressor / biotin---[acetyl-CoA-carboxylase] ligase
MSALGHPRLHLRRTDSTNDRARALAAAGAPHGTLVTAAEQTAGRGRQGRSWSAPPGSSLLMSLLVRWPADGSAGAPAGSGGVEQAPLLLPLIAAVAVCDVVGEPARIKWPNDVVVEQEPPPQAPAGAVLAKLAGILTEGRPQEAWAVVGIGLNVAVRLAELPGELQGDIAQGASVARPAATLGRSREEIEPMLARLLEALERRLREPGEQTLEAWRSRDALRGREIAWDARGSAELLGRGRARGIDGVGRLIVALADGGHATLSAGEVHLAAID